MKKVIGIFSSACLIIAMLTLSLTQASAADELTINKKAKAQKGDKVTFTLNLADTEEEIIGFEMQLSYDPECLTIDNDSFEFPKFDNVLKNAKDGILYLNWTDIMNKADFSQKSVFFSVDFTVEKGGEQDFRYWIREIYGDDMTYLKKYTWTYDVAVNGENVISSEVPELIEDEAHRNKYQGGYVNYEDGKGEKNSPEHVAETGAPNNALINRDQTPENKVGETYAATVVDGKIVEVTRTVDKNNGKGGLPMPVIVGGALVVLGLLIVLAVVLSKKKGNINQSSQ